MYTKRITIRYNNCEKCNAVIFGDVNVCPKCSYKGNFFTSCKITTKVIHLTEDDFKEELEKND